VSLRRGPGGHVRVALVDDEAPARALLREYLGSTRDVRIVAECTHGAEAIPVLDEASADLLFLDVELPGLSGVQVLAGLRSPPPAVIFSTAHASHALAAFEAEAVDFLLKPYDRERFDGSLQRALRSLRSARPAPIWIREGHSIRALRPESIDWVEAMDDYVGLHVGDRTHLVRRTMRELESRLRGLPFLRVHRSAIVNLERVLEARPRGDGRYTLRLGSAGTLTTSRGGARRLKSLVDRDRAAPR